MAAGIETRSNLPRALWPGVKRWTGLAYKDQPLLAEQIYTKLSSDSAYEEDIEATGYGMAHVKAEGQSLSYDAMAQGPATRYVHVSYALGFIVTREQFDDNKYERVAQSRSKALARSFRATKETVAANTLNRGFSSSYVGGDGVALLSASHPTRAGLQSNLLSVAADMSETSLEDAVKLMAQAKNASGIPIMLRPMKLVVGTDYMFEAERILNSTLRVGTPNNDANAIRNLGLFPGGVIVNPYLTDSDAWFIITDAPDGLTWYERTPFEVERDNDFDTKNLKVSGFERYSFGWSDWRAVYGSPGA